jgi:transposase-like protein
MSKELFEPLDGQAGTKDLLSKLMRRGTERPFQQALEEEVTEFLGRARYERSDEESPAVYRNGYRDRTIKTADGHQGNGTSGLRRERRPKTPGALSSRR